MSFKNEETIKDMIADCHKRGVCDGDGKSVKTIDSSGRETFIAKPRILSSTVKTYVYRDGRMVLKHG